MKSKKKHEMRSVHKKLKLSVAILLAVIILLPYLLVEINTVLHKNEFEQLYTQTWEITEDNYCKVFCKRKNRAKVFYATHTSTFMCYFVWENADEKWVLDECDILWSEHGSASDFSFPFYPTKDIKSYLV